MAAEIASSSMCPAADASSGKEPDPAARFCKVAVHAPVGRRLFLYSIPAGIELDAGSSVLVPFRGREIVAWVVSAAAPAAEVAECRVPIKPLIGKIDGGGLRAEDVAVARRLHDIYGTNFSDILALFVPPDAPRPVRRIERVADPLPGESSGWSHLAVALADMIDRASGWLDMGRARRAMNNHTPPSIESAARELTATGSFRIRTEIETARPGKKRFIGPPDAASAADPATGISDARKKIIDIATRHPFQFGGSELAKLAHAPLRDIRWLVSHRLLAERVMRRWRAPMERAAPSSPPADSARIAASPGPSSPVPTAGQASAVAEIARAVDARSAESFLLFGPTASGKTLVYEIAARHALALGKQVLLLVPEIALTKSLVDRVKDRISDPIAVIHSRQTPAERRDEWQRCARGEARLLVGPRSAAYVPLPDLGLVIVDECHDAGYKQSDSPYLDARVTVAEKCRLAGAPVVMGSATPTTEQLWAADSRRNAADDGESNPPVKRLDLTECPTRAVRPETVVIDLRKAFTRAGSARGRGRSFLTPPLEAMISDTIGRKESAVLLINRRGYAPQIACPACGHSERCGKCIIGMTYHAADKTLLCHGCGQTRALPVHCPVCRFSPLDFLGAGTERVESDCRKLFPRARIERLDGDVIRRNRKEAFAILERLKLGQIDILIGTQVIAKGLDIPAVTLAAVVFADIGMQMPDYRSRERAFHLLAQVIGRSGRHGTRGRAALQTFQPDHPSIRFSVDEDVAGFDEIEREERRSGIWPPFCRLIRIVTQSKNAPKALHVARRIHEKIHTGLPGEILLGLSPALPAPWPKINDEYRFQALLRLKSGVAVPPIVDEARQEFQTQDVTVRVEPDPPSIL